MTNLYDKWEYTQANDEWESRPYKTMLIAVMNDGSVVRTKDTEPRVNKVKNEFVTEINKGFYKDENGKPYKYKDIDYLEISKVFIDREA